MRRQRPLKSHQKWTDKKLYPWAIASLILTVLQYLFSLKLIGVGFQYRLWVTWIPLGLGLVTLAYTRRRYLLPRTADEKGLGSKFMLWAFMLLQGLLFSYASFGLLARTAADLLNRAQIKDGPTSFEQHPLHEAYVSGSRGRHRLSFNRAGQREVVRPSACIPELADQRWDPPFDIVLRTTPGVLGTTILLDYSWVRVDRGDQAHP